MCLTPQLMESYVKTNVTQFNPQKEISDMFRKGVIGTVAGWTWVRSNSLQPHTIGTFPTHGVTVVGGGQSGSSLLVIGTNGDTINPGDKFNIALVNAVNPMTRVKNGLGLKQFVFTGGATFTFTGGNDTLPIYPAIFGPGSQYQNVDALPANAAALTAWPGTTSPSGVSGTVSLGLTEYAFAKAFGKFENPEAVEKAENSGRPRNRRKRCICSRLGPVQSQNDKPLRYVLRLREPPGRLRRIRSGGELTEHENTTQINAVYFGSVGWGVGLRADDSNQHHFVRSRRQLLNLGDFHLQQRLGSCN